MTDVTQILSQIESGDPGAAQQLLPLVYEELRKLAAAKLAQEKPDSKLEATAARIRQEAEALLEEKARTRDEALDSCNGSANAI